MKSPVFFRLFGKSPFSKLAKHSDEVVAIIVELEHFFNYVVAEDWDHAEKSFQKISKIELKADKIKLSLRRRLHGQWFMPFSSSLLLEFVHAQDNIANEVKDIAGLILSRRMQLPSFINKELYAMRRCGHDSAVSLSRLVMLLPGLLEAGFKGPMLKEVYEKADQIAFWETEVDKLHYYGRHVLWKVEKDYNPVDVMFWYQVLLFMSRVSDWAERSSARFLLLVTK